MSRGVAARKRSRRVAKAYKRGDIVPAILGYGNNSSATWGRAGNSGPLARSSYNGYRHPRESVVETFPEDIRAAVQHLYLMDGMWIDVDEEGLVALNGNKLRLLYWILNRMCDGDGVPDHLRDGPKYVNYYTQAEFDLMRLLLDQIVSGTIKLSSEQLFRLASRLDSFEGQIRNYADFFRGMSRGMM